MMARTHMVDQRYMLCVRDYIDQLPPNVTRFDGFYAGGGFTYPDALAAIAELREEGIKFCIYSDYWLEPL